MRITGLGCMRLTDVDVGARVIHAALDAGVTWLDTADVYGPTERDRHHNERLVRTALDTYDGDTSRVIVSTKGGLVRTKKRWVPDGRKRHLEGACERSLEALGRDAIDVYFLHAIDPKTSLATSVRALERLRSAGHIRAIGLSNVTVEQLEAAREIAPIAYVQMELGVHATSGFESGVPEACRRLGVRLVASRPFGEAKGVKRIRKYVVLRELAARYACSPEAIALSWLYGLDDTLVALPGATRVETGAAAGRIIDLDEDACRALDDAFPAGRLLSTPREARAPAEDAEGDVVLVLGMPGAGKTTRAASYEDRGYVRLNRDERGGTLAKLVPALEAHLEAGRKRVVLDNTYATRATRSRVIEAAWRRGVPVRCDWIATSLEDCQINAVARMVERHGRLLDEADLRALDADAPNTFGPRVQYRYRDQFETPRTDEGFVRVEAFEFARTPLGDHRALFVDADAYLWPEGVVDVAPEVATTLVAWSEAGFALHGLAWAPKVAADVIAARVAEVARIVGAPFTAGWCPHEAGPPVCWCRPPLPGLVVARAVEARLDLSRCAMLAGSPAYATLAERTGVRRVVAGQAVDD